MTDFVQVQDIEFAQIQSKVVEGLKFGNECLDKMHKVMYFFAHVHMCTCIMSF